MLRKVNWTEDGMDKDPKQHDPCDKVLYSNTRLTTLPWANYSISKRKCSAKICLCSQTPQTVTNSGDKHDYSHLSQNPETSSL